MILFLVSGVPLFILLGKPLFFPGRPADRGVILSYIRGFLWFIPALLIYLAMRNLTSLQFTSSGIYTYYLFHDYLFPILLALAGYLLFCRGAGLPETTMFFGGYFSLFGVLELILRFGRFDFHILFMRPVIFIVLILYLSGMSYLAFAHSGWIRVLFVFMTAAASAVLACVPLLFMLSYRPVSLALCIIFFGAAVFFFRIISGSRRFS